MKELLRHGLNVDSKDRHGRRAVRIAIEESNEDMVNLLVMNGADVSETKTHGFSSSALNEMLQKREIGQQITVPEMETDTEVSLTRNEGEREYDSGSNIIRVSIYRGHPVYRRETGSTEAGRLIRMPNSLEELKKIADRLKKLMEGLRSEFGGPHFQPHVTVVNAIALTKQDALDKFRSGCDGLKAYNDVVDLFRVDSQYTYLVLHSTPEAMEACGHFGYKGDTRKFLSVLSSAVIVSLWLCC